MNIGDAVDIRDMDYVWCKGHIKMVIESAKREPVFLVHYDGFDDSKDEVLLQNSSRLAIAGTYTSRKEIPRHCNNKVINLMEQPKVKKEITEET